MIAAVVELFALTAPQMRDFPDKEESKSY